MSKSFVYNNNKYELDIGLQEEGGEITHLIDDNIGLIEYTNTVNDIVHEGYIEYLDTDQRIDKYLDKMICYCHVVFSQIVSEADGDIEKKTIIDTLPITFFVNNIGILENNPGSIKYKIFLITKNWTDSVKDVDYTNYGKEKEPVFDIIKKILGQAGFSVDADSFASIGSVTSLNYITNRNDNVVTATRYLLNKTQFSKSYTLDTSVKGIVYDEYIDMIHAFDLQSSNAFQKAFPVIVNQMETEVDPIFNTKTNLAFNVKQNKSDLMNTMMTNELYSYSLATNSFSREDISTQDIINFYSSHQKYISVKTLLDDYNFTKSQMTWNNNINIYMDQMKNLTQYGSLILNTAGFMGLIPGCKVLVDIPVKDEMTAVDDKKIQKKTKNSYQALCGYWVASSVKNFINPQKNIFRQNISLMRNIESPSTM